MDEPLRGLNPQALADKINKDLVATLERCPNPSWYKPTKRFSFWDEGSNPKLALFGAKSRLSCGAAWFLLAACTNEKLAVCIEYAADSYNHMAQVCLFDNTCPKWYELERHLALYLHTIFVTKPKVDFLSDIGITPGSY